MHNQNTNLEFFMRETARMQRELKELQQIHSEFNLIADELGASLSRLLITLLAMPSSLDAEKEKRLLAVKDLMRKHHYSPDDYDFLTARFRTDATPAMLATFAAQKSFGEVELAIVKLVEQEDYKKKFQQSLTNANLLDIAKTVDDSEATCFVNPSTSITNAWNTSKSKWSRLCRAALIANQRHSYTDALSHYRWFGRARYEIATLLQQHREEVVFGHLRSDTLFALKGTYLLTKICNKPGSAYVDQFEYCNKALTSLENTPENENVKHTQVEIKVDNQPKRFSVTIIMDPVTQSALTAFYRTRIQGVEFIMVCHPWAVRIPTLYAKAIQPLYQKIFSSNDPSDLYKNIGKIFWYNSHLCALDGGSASANLMFLYDMLHRKNKPLTPFQGAVSPDLLAMFEPNCEKFAEDLEKLMTPQSNLVKQM